MAHAPVPSRPTPSRPARDPRLDALRGYLQLQIFASHVIGSWFGAWAIHSAWGLSDSSEQFVLLSGLGLGSLFALKSARDGFSIARADLLRRTLRLWRIHLMVFAGFAVLILWSDLTMKLPGEVERQGWEWLLVNPVAVLLSAPSMLYQPAFMDILPLFVWCMVVLPGFMWLLARSEASALAASFALYAAAHWGGLALPGLGGREIGFNPFAWQILFAIGAACGRRTLMTGRAMPHSPALIIAALAIVALGLWLRLGWYGWLPDALALPIAETKHLTGKQDLAVPRILHALSCAYLAAWATARDGLLARAVFRPLRDAGRHSLEVFCVGLFLSWGASSALRLGQGALWIDAAGVFAGIAALLVFGSWKERGLGIVLPRGA